MYVQATDMSVQVGNVCTSFRHKHLGEEQVCTSFRHESQCEGYVCTSFRLECLVRKMCVQATDMSVQVRNRWVDRYSLFPPDIEDTYHI